MYQLKLPLQISTIIETTDPVYSFCEVMDSIDLKKYLAAPKSKTGRKRYNPENLLKVILFAFTEFGYVSVRRIEQLCKTDIRFMWLLQDEAAPSHMTVDNFMNETLSGKIEDIFTEINSCIFQKGNADTEHMYICGENRNSYSKTDNDAAFMRMKKDYMGNDQLLPGCNIQLGICDEYIAVYDVKQYASDMDCFQPLMEKFYAIYGKYPMCPVADAGYGSFNNYLYCEEHGMGKYMKFTMFKKETEDEKYRDNPYRAVNFPINERGNLVCPNGKEFHYLSSRPVKGNSYGRTEELYQCEECTNCPQKEKCCKCEGNRIVRINEELTGFYKEVLSNLNSIHGAYLRMNRSFQAEGAFGIIKWNRAYQRIRRRGLKSVILEISMISCGFNPHKYHLKTQAWQLTA